MGAGSEPPGPGQRWPKERMQGRSEGKPPWTTESCAWGQSGDHSQTQAYSEKAKKAKAPKSNGHVCAQSRQSYPTLCSPLDKQAPLSTGFSRQDYWSGLPFPSPGDLPDPGTEPMSLESPAWQGDSSPLALPQPSA